MQMNSEQITYFAETDYRNKRQKFGIKSEDRARHLYVIGKTGMGKSTLLDNMAIQDIQNGNGVAFLDPHGSSADLLLDYIPKERVNDVLYFAPSDADYPISFNVLEDVGYDKRHLVVSGLMSVFEKIWVDQWSSRMAHILQNTLFALLEYPDATLLGVNRMYVDKGFRKRVVDNVTDPAVKTFWTDEFAGYTDRFAADATPAIQNKIGQFVSNPVIRNIIAQPKSSFDFRKIMDDKKIVIVNLSKGQIGESNANILGSMLVTKIYLAALSRADVSQVELTKLPHFNLFVDEFQSFANKSFADILSEARKYKLNLHIAHQYVEQMPEEVQAAVFGNVGTMVTFRIGGSDAEIFEKEFAPQFTAEDMVNLGKFQMYLKLMVDGVSSAPFSAQTFPHFDKPTASYRDMIISHSREQFAKPRAVVEEEILLWHQKRVVGGRVTTPPRKNEYQHKNDQRDRKQYTNKRFPEKATNKRFPDKERELREAMSLDDLKKQQPQEKKKKKKRGASKQHVSELRDALQAVLKGNNENKSQPKQHKDDSGTIKAPSVSKESATQEVPESVLREILDKKKEDK